MSYARKSRPRRFLAALLSCVLVLGMLPASTLQALAATEDVPGAVTVSVTDEENRALPDVTVKYEVTAADSTVLVSDEAKTDANGRVAVLPEDQFTDGLTLSATAELEGYQYEAGSGEIKEEAITSGTQDFAIQLRSIKVPGVTITFAEDLVYNGTAQRLVEVTGADPKEITYTVEGKKLSRDGKPVETNAGTYTVEVTVHRDGYEDLTDSRDVTIAKKTDWVKIVGVTKDYTGLAQPIVEFEKDKELAGDNQGTWYVNGDKIPVDKHGTVPSRTDVGKYEITLEVTEPSNPNYEPYKETVTSYIVPGPIDMEGLTITPNDLTYDGTFQKAVTVEKRWGDYKLEYQIYKQGEQGSDSWTEYNDNDEAPSVPEIKDAGVYVVEFRATAGDSSKPTTVQTIVEMKKQPQSIAFENPAYNGESSSDSVDFTKTPNKTYNFKAKATSEPGVGEITYALDEGVTKDIATITEDGVLTVYQPGTITVTATLAGDDNYAPASVTHVLEVNWAGARIQFEKNSVDDYVLGTNNGIAAENPAKKFSRWDGGKISYSVDQDGLQVDKRGTVTVSDYSKLINAMMEAENRELTVTVKATIDIDRPHFPKEDTISYSFVIKFQELTELPDPLYTLAPETADGEHGWYKSAVTVTMAEGYEVAQTVTWSGGGFASATTFRDAKEPVVFLQKTGTDGIALLTLPIKVDTTMPKVYLDKIVETQENGKEVYKTRFTVLEENFESSGAVAGIKAVDRNGVVLQDKIEFLMKEQWVPGEGENSYTCTVGGYEDGIYDIQFSYKDPAGNQATVKLMEDFIVDNTAPAYSGVTPVEITYSEPVNEATIDGNWFGFYGTGPLVTITFTAYDQITGVKTFHWAYDPQENAPADASIAGFGGDLTAVQDGEDKTKFTATLTLPRETAEQLRGSLSAYATDGYDNRSAKYTDSGKVIVWDTIAPTMTADYSTASGGMGSTRYYNGNATLTFHITEANFFPEDVKVEVFANGGAGRDVPLSWSTETVTPADPEEGTAETAGNTYVAQYTLSDDGSYVVKVSYTDRSGNAMTEWTSDEIVVDTIRPQVRVTYQNQNVISTQMDRFGNSRDYYDQVQTATVTIVERNFSSSSVSLQIVARDVTGAELNADELVTRSSWSSSGESHSITLTYSGDANYTFDVSCTDLAGNGSVDYPEDHFTVDTQAPIVTSVDYSTSVLDTVLSDENFGFYNAKMTITVTAEDATSGVQRFDYSYLNAEGVSGVNAQLLDQAIEEAEIAYNDNGKIATIVIEIPKLMLKDDNQFNGTLKFDAIDRAGNRAEQTGDKRIVVDSIAPTTTVSYNRPVNVVNGISYYSGSINGTITINEANFYAEDVSVLVSRNGGAAQTLATAWTDSSVDTHIGTFTLTEDADYVVTIHYRDKSGNAMAEYRSNQMTVDTKIEAPTYTINGEAKTGDNGGAYKDEAKIGLFFEDQNFASHTVKLVRTRFNETKDVTADFVKVNLNGNGGSAIFDIEKLVENDGIYLLTVTMTDKAGHSTESHVKFTVNRFGSVYEYSEYLTSLIRDGGQYVTKNGDAAITDDLVITEYNADRIVGGTLKIVITRDGEPIDTKYVANPEPSADTALGSSGWYQYVYTISKENFTEDGVYSITITSEDYTGNSSTSVPDNSVDASGNRILDVMTFTVDTTPPEIRNIVNLDERIVNAAELTVKYTIVDVGGLKQVDIYINGELAESITDFGNDRNSYTGEFTLTESSAAQTVRIQATDLAGNVTDTAAEDFDPGELYVFYDTVTVSTNFFVRWQANAGLFWGSIIGVVAVAAGAWYLIAGKKKKQEEENG